MKFLENASQSMTDTNRIIPRGYSDTPFLPGAKWRVHDVERPAPPVVSPGSFSTQSVCGEVPSDASVLFDGTSLSQWTAMNGNDAGWRLVDGLAMEVEGGTGDIRTKAEFGSCQLHSEWRAPTEIKSDSQGRANSGVFLMGLYEIQVLDSFENPTYADGLAGAIYGQCPPLVNACVPPGAWHVFDVVFEAPSFESTALLSPAYLTVFHNGVLIHLRQELQGPTKHRELASYKSAHGPCGPLVLQDHGDPVRFRNIWIRELERLEAE